MIAIFGGSFNPPHIAHVLAVVVVQTRLDLDKLLVVPAFKHPFAKTLAPYEDRLEMCRRAMGFLPKIEISRIEEELGGESKTLRTVEHVRARYPDQELRLVMGADLVLESSKWFGFDRIAALAPPIVLGRVGIDYPGAPRAVLPAISSSEVRAALASDGLGSLEHLVPKAVIEYVHARQLYRLSEARGAS